MFLGAPKYAVPEIRSGADQASPASDIYAFGVMGYEILTGRSLQDSELVHPSQADPRISPFLGDAIVRCLLTNPAQRPQSFAVLAGFFSSKPWIRSPSVNPPEGSARMKNRRARIGSKTWSVFSASKQFCVSKWVSGRSWRIAGIRVGDVVIKIMEAPGGAEYLRE